MNTLSSSHVSNKTALYFSTPNCLPPFSISSSISPIPLSSNNYRLTNICSLLPKYISTLLSLPLRSATLSSSTTTHSTHTVNNSLSINTTKSILQMHHSLSNLKISVTSKHLVCSIFHIIIMLLSFI